MSELLYVDVSKHQKTIDYVKMSKCIDGVIIRCGYTGWGTSRSKQKDDLFEKHYKGFSEQNVPIGVYWYSCAISEAEAIKEAELTLEYIKGKNISLPVWYDTEDDHNQIKLSKQALSKVALAYCKTIEKAGYYVGIYSYTSWFNNQLDVSMLKDYDKWVAHYGVSKPNYSGSYGMWQYTSSGRVDGCNSDIDMNKVYKDYAKIIKDNKLNNQGSLSTEQELEKYKAMINKIKEVINA